MMKINLFKFFLVILCAGTIGFSMAAERVIKIIVPFGPGAVQDTVARTFVNELGAQLGAVVVIENHAGAGGTIGTSLVAKAPADGNTLVMSAASHTLTGYLYEKLPYDPIKDFQAVSLVGFSGYIIAAPQAFGANNLREYIKLIKANPKGFNYASAGNGSASHLGMASFLARAGLEMQHIPMKATGDAVNEVLANRVQGVTSATVGVVGFRKDPRIRLLAYTGRERSKFLPEIPTVSESGLPGFSFDSWMGLLAPANTPKAEIEKINQAMIKVLANPEVQDRLVRLGLEVKTASSDEFEQILKEDWINAGLIVKSSGAKLE
jgi:tripartite-type tricarboxylate transporter receptor subunit TctC